MTLNDRCGEPGFSDPDLVTSHEIPVNRHVDFAATVSAVALTARATNAKYRETSERGLAVSVVLR
jgi:hypothetical protein